MHGRDDLLLHRGPLGDSHKKTARDKLVREVLGLDARGPDSTWRTFCYFAPNGSCVANVEAAVLPLMADGARLDVGAIRAIAVDPNRRGQGLFRDLMGHALTWCDCHAIVATLLYTEGPTLYRRFGFEPVPQHAFVGAAPAPTRGPAARRLTPHEPEDAAVIQTAIGCRAPVSMRCALLVDGPSFVANLAQDADLVIAHAGDLGALIVYEDDDDLLTVVDIVAATIPRLGSMIGALGMSPKRVKTLFPPDLLDWEGVPVAEETGLMVRGSLRMTRPFMFPPTSEF